MCVLIGFIAYLLKCASVGVSIVYIRGRQSMCPAAKVSDYVSGVWLLADRVAAFM